MLLFLHPLFNFIRSKSASTGKVSPYLLVLTYLVSAIFFPLSAHSDSAREIFKTLKPAVYQIRIIDLASGEKSSFGSGFSVTNNGHIVTNFHVVSSYLHEPEKYRIEVLDQHKEISPATLINIDVIHDLAIITIEQETENFIQLNLKPLAKGDRIFSMGNPLDLGMTIIEGTYNGLVQISRFKKILFSGSLNAGMSGGPALDNQGRVIGVNVSKGDEQISFLVPVRHVHKLVEQALKSNQAVNFQQSIKQALLKDQQTFYQSLLNKSFLLDQLGQLEIPGKISPALKCWGHTVDEEDIQYQGVHTHCRSEDVIYIADDFKTGTFAYDYEWLTADNLNSFQFYHLIEQRFIHKTISSSSKEKHVKEYQCVTDHIGLAQHSWKASTCLRAYKKYDGLYDALLLLASVDSIEQAAIIRVGISGISRDNALLFFNKMMKSIQWKP